MSNLEVGQSVHYRGASSVCHPAILVSPATSYGTSDLIQQDTLSLGIVVPTKRTSVTCDNQSTITQGNWHDLFFCPGE